jgi:hypothetical protein
MKLKDLAAKSIRDEISKSVYASLDRTLRLFMFIP